MGANDIYKKISHEYRIKYKNEEVRDLLMKLVELGLGKSSKGIEGCMKFKATKPWPKE